MTVAGQPLRLLHLEDSLADHVLAKLTLQRARLDCTLQQVDTLQDFCDRTQSESFDLILADYRLQGFTALDAWEHVAKLATPVPFVLLSGAIGEAAAVDAMRLGFSDYLLKDDISRLPHVVTRAIEVHQARQDRERAPWAAGSMSAPSRARGLASHCRYRWPHRASPPTQEMSGDQRRSVR